MSTITHNNIKIEGFPFEKIRQLYIQHSINEHAKAVVVGETNKEEGEECLKRINEQTGILITTTANNQPQKLFVGKVKSTSLEYEAEYTVVYLEIESTSKYIDVKKNNKTFQNTNKTYEEILNDILQGMGSVHLHITDEPIEKMIIQYNETNWAFIKRMASRFNAPVIANIIANSPHIQIGIPETKEVVELATVSFQYVSQENRYKEIESNYLGGTSGGVIREDFAAVQVESYTYGYLGNKVIVNGKKYYIKNIEAKLIDGILTMKYILEHKTGFVVPMANNVQSSGRMLKGIVQEVKRDLVRVHFFEIDEGFDGSGNWWFPYSTAYSSNDGSGWYCMPEIGDTVRVFFPSNNESEAFAASSVNVSPQDNPRHKSWKAPSGKEILLTDEGIFIICNNQKIFIQLLETKGIQIVSSENISVCSSKNIVINATKSVQLYGDESVVVGTPESYIEMNKEGITLGAKRVHIN